MWTELFWRKVGLEFGRTFIVFFILGLIPVLDVVADGNWSVAQAALVALIGGAANAGLRAAQALFTQLETPPELKQQ